MIDHSKVLPVGSVLRSESRSYTIVDVIGQGGFGITYKAIGLVIVDNIKVKAQFAIKEHFIDRYCERDDDTQAVSYSRPVANEVENSRKDFLSEARRLRDLSKGQNRHPNIVCVNETFEANNTAYFVMEYLDGESLSSCVKRCGQLSDSKMRAVMMPIIDAVAFLHRERIIHLDIKPGNIMLTRDDDGKLRPVLIDFGLSRHFDPDTDEASSSIQQAGFSEGYAPVEQIQAFKKFYPATDVYSLGATMLYSLTGRTPMAAEDMNDETLRNSIPAGLPESTCAAITAAMHHFRNDRPENAAALLSILNSDDTHIIPPGHIIPDIYDPDKTTLPPSVPEPLPIPTPVGEPTELPASKSESLLDSISEPVSEPTPKSKKGLYIGLFALIVIIVIAILTRGFGLFDKTETSNSDSTEDAVYFEVPNHTDEEMQPEEPIEAIPISEEYEALDERLITEVNKIEEVEKEKEIMSQDEAVDTAAIGTKTNDGIDDLTRSAVKHEIVEQRPKEVEKPNYEEAINMAMVEQKPQFPGGETKMYQWLSQNIVYPAQAHDEGIQGKVYVQFIVEKDGSISNAKVARSKHPALEAEALRAVKKMPRWTPGRNNGQPVRVTYILPVTFKL